jgi:uncharacterized membrane protein
MVSSTSTPLIVSRLSHDFFLACVSVCFISFLSSSSRSQKKRLQKQDAECETRG